ncbi:MAG: ATP-binding protein [Polyangiaceae bacterium]|nr:ATP-binding protein [Polyangiaceae bacterium]
MWTCTKCVMSELDDTLQYEAQRVHASASTCDFAVFSWALRRMASGGEPVELKMTKAQFLDPTVSRPMCSHICDIIPRACCYVDFATVRAFAWDDALTYTKELAQALKLFDNRITGVSTTGFPSSLSVIVDNSQEISLGALGTGAVAWTGTLMKMLGTVERHSDDNHASDLNTPIFVLIDQVGAGIHHSAMDDIWAYFRRLADMHPHVQFVMTSHGDDSVRAFCKAFNIDGDSASVVTMHRTYDGDFVRTQVEQPKFKNITSGRWEVR